MKTMKIWKNTVLFYLGGGSYVCLELLWRGRSHGSMFLLGGTCFSLIGIMERKLTRVPPAARMLAGAGMVTVLELGTGLAVNRDFHVWDYRQMPLNYRGQICLNYSLLWVPAVLAGMVLYRCAQRQLNRVN